MNCNDVRENLVDVLAGEQAAPEVTAHLRQCNACTAELDGLRKTMALLDEWEAPAPSPYFVSRVQAHVREEREKTAARSGFLAWLRRPVLAGSLATLLVAGGALYRFVLQQPTSPPVGTAAADVEQLDKNSDLYLNTDLIDELSGGPSDDVAEP
jgi:anti-sigma factor RsiW